MPRDEHDEDEYVTVRRIIALAFAVTAAVLTLIDAFSEPFEVSPVVLGFLIGGALVAAGVDTALAFLERRR